MKRFILGILCGACVSLACTPVVSLAQQNPTPIPQPLNPLTGTGPHQINGQFDIYEPEPGVHCYTLPSINRSVVLSCVKVN